MVTLISNAQIQAEPWLWLDSPAALAALPAQAGTPPLRVAIPLALWPEAGERLHAAGYRLGVSVPVDAPLEPLAALAARVELIAVVFPQCADGRGLSLGRLLRERCGFTGALRAAGAVGTDTVADLNACGFDAFELASPEAARQALARLAPFSESYQATVVRPVPLFRRRPGA
jgi:uncharacterized protein (DUF934 family)